MLQIHGDEQIKSFSNNDKLANGFLKAVNMPWVIGRRLVQSSGFCPIQHALFAETSPEIVDQLLLEFDRNNINERYEYRKYERRKQVNTLFEITVWNREISNDTKLELCAMLIQS